MSLDDRRFMELAVDTMSHSIGPTKVGAVIAIEGRVVGVAARGEVHAERSAIEQAQAQGLDLRAGTLYTTLEPCIERHASQRIPSCASLVVAAGIRRVFIGRYDPNPLVHRLGWRHLRDAKVELKNFPRDLRERIDALNREFIGFFSRGVGPKGGAKVDHKDQARFIVQLSPGDERTVEIGWSTCGKDSAYAIARDGVEVTPARCADSFADIDDPDAHGPFKHFAKLKKGEVGIFRNVDAFVLVKVNEVESGPDYGDAGFFVTFEYEVRLRTAHA